MRTALWPEAPDDHPVEIQQFFAAPRDERATFVADREVDVAGHLGQPKPSSPVLRRSNELANAASQDAHQALGYAEADRIICYRKPL